METMILRGEPPIWISYGDRFSDGYDYGSGPNYGYGYGSGYGYGDGDGSGYGYGYGFGYGDGYSDGSGNGSGSKEYWLSTIKCFVAKWNRSAKEEEGQLNGRDGD